MLCLCTGSIEEQTEEQQEALHAVLASEIAHDDKTLPSAVELQSSEYADEPGQPPGLHLHGKPVQAAGCEMRLELSLQNIQPGINQEIADQGRPLDVKKSPDRSPLNQIRGWIAPRDGSSDSARQDRPANFTSAHFSSKPARQPAADAGSDLQKKGRQGSRQQDSSAGADRSWRKANVADAHEEFALQDTWTLW